MEYNEIVQAIEPFDKKTQKEICVRFTIACAEKCLHYFEEVFPNDKRPRDIILSSKRWLKNPRLVRNYNPNPNITTVFSTNTHAAIYAYRVINLAAEIPWSSLDDAIDYAYDAALALLAAFVNSHGTASPLAPSVRLPLALSLGSALNQKALIIDWQRKTLENICNNYRFLALKLAKDRPGENILSFLNGFGTKGKKLKR